MARSCTQSSLRPPVLKENQLIFFVGFRFVSSEGDEPALKIVSHYCPDWPPSNLVEMLRVAAHGKATRMHLEEVSGCIPQ